MTNNKLQNNIIIVAGGKGVRMGNNIPKQFLILKDKPILMHTLERFHQFQTNLNIILVLPKDQQTLWSELCQTYNFKIPHTIVQGGKTRFHSVINGLSKINNIKGITGVHDGVRPFVSIETIKQCFSTARNKGTAIPVVKLIDSIREINHTTSVAKSRINYRLVQTPQVFKTNILKEAYSQKFNDEFTDDASVIESAGYKVNLVEGNYENIKITSPLDMIIAKALILDKEN